MQTTIRFRSDYPAIRQELTDVFLSLFNQHGADDPDAGFEVVTTFNAVLSNRQGTTFSIFYGHDYRAGNVSGAFSGLRHGDPVVVRTLADLGAVPSHFDLDALAAAHRHSFDSSNVRVVSIINVVYLVYQFRASGAGTRSVGRKVPGKGPAGSGVSRGRRPRNVR